jgi:hypothetical protein
VLAWVRKAGLDLLGRTLVSSTFSMQTMMLDVAGSDSAIVSTLLKPLCCGASIAAAGRSAKSRDCPL